MRCSRFDRLLFSFTALLLCAGTIVFDRPATFEPLRYTVNSIVSETLYRKEVAIFGAGAEREELLRSMLPYERSVLWWLGHGDLIVARLMQDPYIAKAEVRPCDPLLFRAWGCFAIAVTEEKPRYIADVGGKQWLISEGGAFIEQVGSAASPLKSELFQEGQGSIKVEGLAAEGISPDVVRARMSYVHDALEVIEKQSGFSVSSVEIDDNAELAVGFADLSMMAKFDFQDADLQRLADEARRLRHLLERLGSRGRQVKEVDLAYNNLAVVTFDE